MPSFSSFVLNFLNQIFIIVSYTGIYNRVLFLVLTKTMKVVAKDDTDLLGGSESVAHKVLLITHNQTWGRF